MKNTNKTNKGFSLPEVIIAITVIVVIIITATNLLVTSMRANQSNVNKIIAYNLAQEALEGFRNIRDGLWMHNQYWRGSNKNLFGASFEKDGSYVIKKKQNLLTTDSCSNEPAAVQSAAPWELVNFSEDRSQLYLIEGEVKKYVHEVTDKKSKFSRWVEVQNIPYDLASDENKDKLKIAVTAVVQWTDGSQTKEIRIPTVLTDWKAGPL